MRSRRRRAPRRSPRLRILVVHGPNLNLLGRREPQIYGTTTLDQINARLAALAKEIDVELVTVQSNQEGAIVDAFQAHMDDVDGAIINAAGLSFSSVSIHDVIKAEPFPSSKCTSPTWRPGTTSTATRSSRRRCEERSWAWAGAPTPRRCDRLSRSCAKQRPAPPLVNTRRCATEPFAPRQPRTSSHWRDVRPRRARRRSAEA